MYDFAQVSANNWFKTLLLARSVLRPKPLTASFNNTTLQYIINTFSLNILQAKNVWADSSNMRKPMLGVWPQFPTFHRDLRGREC